jgi:hypothetical protein
MGRFEADLEWSPSFLRVGVSNATIAGSATCTKRTTNQDISGLIYAFESRAIRAVRAAITATTTAIPIGAIGMAPNPARSMT